MTPSRNDRPRPRPRPAPRRRPRRPPLPVELPPGPHHPDVPRVWSSRAAATPGCCASARRLANIGVGPLEAVPDAATPCPRRAAVVRPGGAARRRRGRRLRPGGRHGDGQPRRRLRAVPPDPPALAHRRVRPLLAARPRRGPRSRARARSASACATASGWRAPTAPPGRTRRSTSRARATSCRASRPAGATSTTGRWTARPCALPAGHARRALLPADDRGPVRPVPRVRRAQQRLADSACGSPGAGCASAAAGADHPGWSRPAAGAPSTTWRDRPLTTTRQRPAVPVLDE